MSGGDWTQNPFAASDSDPFSDPSVTAASVGKIPEYNPFEGDKAATQEPASSSTKDVIAQGAASFGSKGNKSPTVATAGPAPAPAPAPVAQAQAVDDKPAWAAPAAPAAPAKPAAAAAKASAKSSTKATATKVTEVTSNDEALRRQEYEQRELQVRALKPKADPNYRPSNWPPFSPKCPTPFKPCFHQDFEGEIPAYAFRISKECYYMWMVVGIAYFWNFVVCLAALDTSNSGTSQSAGISCAYMVLGTPCAYCCWFHYLYNAFRLDSSMRYGWWFFVTGMQFLFSVFMALGIPTTGAGGIWSATSAISDYKIVGIMLYSNGLLWSFIALWTVWICKRVLTLYRSTGQSTIKARGELRAVGNQAVYNAVTSDAGQAAIKGAVASSWPPPGGEVSEA